MKKQFRNIENKLDRNPENVMYRDLYNNINNQIKEVEIKEAQGAKIRSKAHWREQGETSSRYFCSLEKKRGAERPMRSVQLVKDGEIYNTTDDMVRHATSTMTFIRRKEWKKQRWKFY